MRENDGRKLSHEALEEIRIRAVQQVQAGESPEKVIAALGLTRACIYNWLAIYQSGGLEALRAKKLYGRPTKLTPGQMKQIYRMVVGKNPLQLQFEFALWTREMVREVIKRRFQVSMSEVSVGRLLAKLGLTCQRPLHRAYEQDPEAVERWLKVQYPKIAALAKREGAEVFFGDESGIRSDYHAGTTWAPAGQTPVVRTTGQRFSLNMISAISPKGNLRFMVKKGSVNAAIFCVFLKRLMHNRRRPVFLIIDGHPTHRSSKVKRCVNSFQGKLRIYFLPSYSPELNPDELVWNTVKSNVGKRTLDNSLQLKKKVVSIFRSLQKTPQMILSLFREPSVVYILNLCIITYVLLSNCLKIMIYSIIL
jgi:transposase